MILRATSDLHLTTRSARWVFEALDALHADDAEHGGITVIVGDVFDQAENVHMPTFNRLRDTLASFRGDVFVTVGNHDQYNGRRNACEALAGGRVRVISETAETEIGLAVPYVPASEFWPEVKAHNGDAHKYWWTHQGWRGSYLNNMVRNRDGLSPANIGADLVISGHYHMPQVIGPVIYCGSPWQTSFAEEGQAKGWLRWATFDPNAPEPPKRIAFETTAPRHWTVEWNPNETEAPQRPEGSRDGDRIRIVTTATRSEVKDRAKAIKRAGLEGASIVAQAAESRRNVIDRTAKPRDAARQYIDRVFGPKTGARPVDLHEWAKDRGVW
jgi:DNA repair exonuclease SbcCD nuclease subunit